MSPISRLIKKLGHFEGLIIDDLGYVQQSREEMEVLFTLLAERYERGSVLISSNLPFSKWEGIFKDPMTTAAAIDRLVHHCVILELNIPSYRVEQAKKAKAEASVEQFNGALPQTPGFIAFLPSQVAIRKPVERIMSAPPGLALQSVLESHPCVALSLLKSRSV